MSQPIGIFDSGVGGLTVARAIADQLPAERLRYVGDTANGPYGPLPIAQVRRHALAVADDLVAGGVKLLVMACNTASAACLADARERYDIPVVEVVIPAVRRAVAVTRTGRVGVIGTNGTIRSGAYQDAFAAARDVVVTAAACPRFVDFVERGITSGRQVLGLAQAYLEPLQQADVDTVVLGCTHYPLLTGILQIVMGDAVTLVSSAEETAKDVVRVLTEHDLLAEPDAGGASHELLRADRAQHELPGAGCAQHELLRADRAQHELPGAGCAQHELPRAGCTQHELLATGPAEPFARLARRFLGPRFDPIASLTGT